jgi:hypothetical protein
VKLQYCDIKILQLCNRDPFQYKLSGVCVLSGVISYETAVPNLVLGSDTIKKPIRRPDGRWGNIKTNLKTNKMST